MSIDITTAPTPPDIEQLLRQLRLPHIRRIAGEVLATAKSQRWEAAEVLRAVLTEEVNGRAQSRLAAAQSRWLSHRQNLRHLGPSALFNS